MGEGGRRQEVGLLAAGVLVAEVDFRWQCHNLTSAAAMVTAHANPNKIIMSHTMVMVSTAGMYVYTYMYAFVHTNVNICLCIDIIIYMYKYTCTPIHSASLGGHHLTHRDVPKALAHIGEENMSLTAARKNLCVMKRPFSPGLA